MRRMRGRLAAFAFAHAAARALARAARVLGCAGAGLLSLDDLRLVIARRWATFGASEPFVDSGLLAWETELYATVLRPDDEILVVGCGTGRDVVALARAGHRVEGLEPAPRAATIARAALRARGLDVPVTIGGVEHATLARPYDVVVFSWYCYSYIPSRGARVAALRRVRERLRGGGRIVVSYLVAAAPPGRGAVARAALTRLTARLSRSDWRPEPGDELSVEGRGLHFEHHFRPGDVEAEAHDAGLGVVFHVVEADGRIVLTAHG